MELRSLKFFYAYAVLLFAVSWPLNRGAESKCNLVDTVNEVRPLVLIPLP